MLLPFVNYVSGVCICFVSLFVVASSSAINCLERLVSETTCYVSSGTLNPTHSLTHSGLKTHSINVHQLSGFVELHADSSLI